MPEIKINEKLLDEQLGALEKARVWSPRVVSKLESLLRSGDDFSLFRINPLRFGTEKNILESEAIDLFLHGAYAGLFDMNWQLVCPGCGDTVESFKSLRNLNSHYFCAFCHSGGDASLDDFIQINFTVSPNLRKIAFHEPGTLSVEDFCFKYHFSREARLPKGPLFGEFVKSQTQFMSFISARGKKSFQVDAGPGVFMGYDFAYHLGFVIPVEGLPAGGVQKIVLKVTEDKIELSVDALRPGVIAFEVENSGPKRGCILCFHLPPGIRKEFLEFDPFLSGKKLLTTQTFRDLFRTEVIQGSEGLGVKDIAILFTDLKGSTAMYDRIGDLKAFSMVRQHFDSLGAVIARHRGAIVKTIGDAIMASFLNPLDALQAALDMLSAIESFNGRVGRREIILKIGIHKGASIAVTLNERLDYFGQTVNIAARVQGLADAEEIYVTQDVMDHPGVTDSLAGADIKPGTARLKGIEEEMKVYRIRRAAAPLPA